MPSKPGDLEVSPWKTAAKLEAPDECISSFLEGTGKSKTRKECKDGVSWPRSSESITIDEW